MTSAADRLAPAVARVLGPDGGVVGAGFLIAPDTVCTCAHVVAHALGREEVVRSRDVPEGAVTLDFPLLRDTPHGRRGYPTRTSAWEPVVEDGGGDIALLRLPEELPEVVRPVPLVSGTELWGHRFRALGFPAGSEHGQWAQGRVRDRVGAGWIALSEEFDRLRRISPGFSGSPVWDEELGGVIGMVVATARGEREDTAYLVPSAALVDMQPGLRRCPYRGLEPFREEDAEFFYGREVDVRRVTDAVLRHPVVTVVGASGSGKSSLVRAGVLPELRARGHSVTVFRPIRGARPVRALAKALEIEPGAAEGDVTETAALLTEELLERSGDHGHVLFLDQFEEVAATEPDEARRLLALTVAMTRAVRPVSGRVLRVVATLRHGSLDGLVEPGMAGLLSDGTQIIAPLDRPALLRAITGSAGRVPGLAFEPGLAERIVDDAEAEPGCLPLVQFALTRLWEKRRHTLLTHAAYESLGRVGGALTAYAEHSVAPAMADLGEDTLRRLLAQLARPDEKADFVRIPARLDGLDPQLRHAAHALSQTRLVILNQTAEGEDIVDLAHESLIRQWPRAHAWLEESREFRAWQEQVRAATAVWQQNARDPGALMRGAVLERALEWRTRRSADIGKEELAYIEQSDWRRRRGVRVLRVTTACIALLALAAGLLAVFAFQKAAQQRAANDRIASQVLAAEADTRLGSSPSQSIALALEAWRRSHTAQARAALLNQYVSLSSTKVLRVGAVKSGVTQYAASADGRVIILLTQRGRRKTASVVTALDSGTARMTPLSGVPQEADAVDVDDAGTRVAVAGPDGGLAVWGMTDGRWDLLSAKRWTPVRKTDGLATLRLDFSPDGRRLLHLTGNSGRSCPTTTGWRAVWTVSRHPERVDSVVGRPRGGDCVTDAAIVTNGGDVAVVRDGPRKGLSSVVVEAHSAAPPHWALADVPSAAFAASGRGISVFREDRYYMIAAYLIDGAGRLSKRTVTGTGGSDAEVYAPDLEMTFDLTGRFAVGVSIVGGWTMLLDLRTHKIYQVRSPAQFYTTTALLSVVAPADRVPWVVQNIGDDLVRSEARAVAPATGKRIWEYVDNPALLTTDHAVYLNEQTDDATVTVAPRHGGGKAVRLTPSGGPWGWNGYNPLTTDDSFFGYWDEQGLSYLRLDDSPPAFRPMPAQGPDHAVHGAAALNRTEVAVLTQDGLSRYSFATPARPPERVAGAPCVARGRTSRASETCVGLVARPDHPGQVAVLFGDGRVELWTLREGGTRRLGTVEAAVDVNSLVGYMYSGFPVAFTEHGDGLVVMSFGWISLWKFDSDRPEWSVSVQDADLRGAFVDSGVFYLRATETVKYRPLKVSDTAPGRIVPIAEPGDVVVHGDTMDYMVGYETVRVPLHGADLVTALCTSLDGKYEGGDLNSILHSVGVENAGHFCP
ncbi:hypothetical protein DI272_06630 [Streptomyces sp. Act143]|uniref:serine protease n=1 Tax=Streptomyces sp. Act143 TaxID=2200760 RepID=UPI000D673FEE|nr:serine protease [Streptomyces sp. Act143]PWI13857.1 hypothetical protein DI272_06630 [Streptomyces sp. Act143]